MKIQFHVGDRVVGNGYCAGIDISGMPGTVVMDDEGYDDGIYGIRFDEYNWSFHSLSARGGDHCEPGHGLWVDCRRLSKESSWDLSKSHGDLCELL